MGNQESVPAIEHHSFYKKDLKKYITVYGDVQISPFRGVFERYYLLPGDKPDTYRVQAVGLSNEEKKYIIMTANNNIRLSTTEERLGDDALWCFESRAAERAKDKDGEWIAMRSYTSAHYLGVVANAVRAIPSYSCDSCLLLHRKQMMTDKQEADLRKVANWFGDAKSKAVDYPECHLTEEQILSYQRDGYLHIEGLLSPEAVSRARAKIQEGLDRNIDKLKTWYSDQAWTAEFTQSPDIINLMTGTPLFKTCEALFGTVCPLIPPSDSQIALRITAMNEW